MISPEESKRIWEQVKANHARLGSCSDHDFELVKDKDHPWRRRYICSRCAGEIEGGNYFWYVVGRRQGSTHGPLKVE